ncbi:MAG: hypothetical protein ACFFFT_05520 [Candidatus Thorarchaeota archaeon]
MSHSKNNRTIATPKIHESTHFLFVMVLSSILMPNSVTSGKFYLISPLYMEYFLCPAGQTSIYHDIMDKTWKISSAILHVCSIYQSRMENQGG